MYWLSKKRYKIMMMLPSLILYTIFIILPIGMAVFYSFTKYTGLGKAKLNGITNYIRLFNDNLFWTSLKNTMIIFALAFVLLLIISFLLANLLNKKIRGTGISKALIFSPAMRNYMGIYT